MGKTLTNLAHLSSVLAVVLMTATNSVAMAGQTVGGGDINKPAKGPAPAYDYGDGMSEYVLVKNWDFGSNGTIKNMSDMDRHFQYHDQFGTIANGTKYGAYMVASNASTAISNQPIEGVNTDRPVRELSGDALRTYLVGLDGAKEVHPKDNKAGSGSFQAKWTLPKGGSLLGQDMIWETRIRYKTPPYFWFAIWTAGNKWDDGAEMDVIESFGWDNGGGNTNYDGHEWHSSVVGGDSETNYHANWGNGMRKYGIDSDTFNEEDYHVWTWVYRADDTFTSYMDGKVVQRGSIPWTLRAKMGNEPLDMSFIFDGAWGHREVDSVNHTLNVSEFDDKFYEWDYSRVYLRDAAGTVSVYGDIKTKENPAGPILVSFTDGAQKMSVTAEQNATIEVIDEDKSRSIKVDFSAGNYPGVLIKALADNLDFSGFSGVEMDITNTSSFPLGITARVDNEGDWTVKPWSAESKTFAPGETQKIVVTFGKTHGSTGFSLDPSQVTQILVFANTPKEDGSLVVNSLNAVK